MAKRKRDNATPAASAKPEVNTKKTKPNGSRPSKSGATVATFQIVTGSYDGVLHGVTAMVQAGGDVKFADTFLFNAHTSAIRCLALSPPSAPIPGQSQKLMLATGSTDERINVYNLSAHPPKHKADQDLLSSIAPRPILESSKNRELGTLLHHSSTVTKLVFPTRSKLLSSSDDSTIAVTRTRDWSLLSSIKAPIPNVQGRPSGDTAPMGGTPSGVNDFAIHPSMKLMISVSKGERSMRLWNLVTGKKAGVLNFSRDILAAIGERKHSTGEGRQVVWGTSEGEGDEFAVGFDRNILVFSMDSTPKCKVMPDERTKTHEFRYIQLDEESDATVLAVATEDGRIIFFSTKTEDLIKKPESEEEETQLPTAKLLSTLGGKDAGVSGRIKDFSVLQLENDPKTCYIVSGSSDGKLRLWQLTKDDLALPSKGKSTKQVGKLLGIYDTQNRITCVEAFVMIPRPDGVEDSDEELDDEVDDESDGGSEED
ncbi:putative 60s ribosome biogenesis protein [Phaeoacremonium minimum UCRPA7]|uniref:Putative 60s ribosome biogenesis protein n=1 Tax=Phaeoacremonium minimum (strain UCR-PA7) TaxID=1286976 RepID=R8BTY7_PHAM7|nr:putative 60s ribosome biogenesis protein [Phaeoacremonium minimum UCRPA7]EOO02837.1 putative 60s ribosome biogenesis protein [Phaeoacremonium minimum UCRPA7]